MAPKEKENNSIWFKTNGVDFINNNITTLVPQGYETEPKKNQLIKV